MKKKLLITFLVVAMLVCVLAACGGNKTPECAHNWEETSTTATCENAGTATMTCSLCGATQEQTTMALGHQFERTETVKATCKTGGYDIYSCKNCDATEERNKTNPDYSPAGHQYVQEGKEPTCTTAGYEDNICQLCGSGDGNRVQKPALKHTYFREGYDGITGLTLDAPKCEVSGKLTYQCQDCDVSVSYTYDDLVKLIDDEKPVPADADPEDIKPLEHVMVANLDKKTEATCEAVGQNWEICQNGCGKEEQVADTPALGHTYTRESVGTVDYNYEVTQQPTCIKIGYKWVVCGDCGHCTADDENPDVDAYRLDVPATGKHVFERENPVVTAPTCTEAGYTTYGCSVDPDCVETEDRDPVAALDHDWVLTVKDLLNGTTPTCKTNGDYPYHCSRCDATSVNENGEANNGAKHLGYTKGNFEGGVAPTCISRGQYYCTDCKTVFNAYPDDTLADAHGNHVYNRENPVVTAPTCSTYGYTTYGCSADAKCTETQDRDYVARTSHTFFARSEDGTIVCMNCSETYIDSTTIIAQDERELCDHETPDETCETCGIGVIITGTKTPDPAYQLEAGVALTTEFLKGAALIELKGDTSYQIAAYDKDGNQITTYDVVLGEVDTGYDLDVKTTANGTTYVDLTEIETEIAKIVVTATADAEVVFYVTEANVTVQPIA